MYDRISDFYDGKSVFVTGASGFLGSVLLEILLRCLPGIKHVYVLLRAKKGKDPQERKNVIFRKKIFEKLLNESPNIVDKVKVVSGDISLPNLGMSEEDLHKITQEVSIVFHCAALLTFKLPYKVSIEANTLGTKSVIELCRKLKNKCEALVYTSTIYSHTHLNNKSIEEKNYGSPFPIETVLNDLENKDDEWFLNFLSKYNCKFPNSYTFSKFLTENILCEEVTDLPVIIVRPSIIFGALKGSRPGYIETGFGSIQVPLLMGSGLSSVFIGKEVKIHLIPVDIVVNTLIVSTFIMNNRCSSPLILNCTCGEFWNINTRKYMDKFKSFFSRNVLPNSFRSPTWTSVENNFSYGLFRMYKDLLPCFVIDAVSYLKGEKLRLMPIQREIDNLVSALTFFTSTSFNFSIDTFKTLPKHLHPEDNKIFYTELSGTNFEDVLDNLSFDSNLFNWKKDKLSPNSRKYSVLVNTMVATFIKRFSLFMVIGLTYLIIYKTFL